jgi:hypothetical protein
MFSGLSLFLPSTDRLALRASVRATVVGEGSIADDSTGPLLDRPVGEDVPLDRSGGPAVSQVSHDFLRPYWIEIAATVLGRCGIDRTGGSERRASGRRRPRGDRDAPAGHRRRDPLTTVRSVDGVEAAASLAQSLRATGP